MANEMLTMNRYLRTSKYLVSHSEAILTNAFVALVSSLPQVIQPRDGLFVGLPLEVCLSLIFMSAIRIDSDSPTRQLSFSPLFFME